ncbi:pyridoxal phosphate-dependent aminotransferase [Roseisolibacter sp. H3M3-2]|uniref:pyridoxal phosphate-dependent aminotransferase n=1 Tax=Roseisolibacter sp. H3M3-2 TaxID=3031323 RepID=UPI0023DC970F|nr:pyridoxal phosphate-dependent aminotransferase [Roseisolibacter sp. H3M3-2]MDF1505668.1 pyridoxal phosphate-dependent aminotransferase [Roseisolibacter sp. H3M3-2]
MLDATTAAPALADRLARLSGEGALDVFRRATALKREGRTIVHLELGAPDVDAAPHVVDEAVRALREGDARYVAPAGIPALREAIAADVRSRGVEADADQVLVTPSAKTAVFYAMLAAVGAGDEVLVPDPGFPIYPSMARFCGGVPVGYGVDAHNAPDVDDLEARIGPRTRVVVLNSPNNPTGGALDAAATARVAALAERHGLVVVTDDIYSRLVYEGDRAPSPAAFDGARDRTLLVDGFSKTYAMTGYRLGYLVAPRPWLEPLTTLAINGHTCVPPFIQRAGVAALTGPQDLVASQRAAYRARRDLLVAGLNAIPGVRCPTPAGAFYVFPDFSEALAPRGLTSRELAHRLLEDHGVAAIDGRAFGARGEGRLRFSFASAEADLERAVARVAEAVAGLSVER